MIYRLSLMGKMRTGTYKQHQDHTVNISIL